LVIAFLAVVVGFAVAAPAIGQTAIGGSDGSDDKVSGQTYVRHDGGTDRGIQHCNDTATSPAPDNAPNDGDADSNDGGSRRQGNEPFSVIDPTDPETVVAGWNDYCLSDLGAGWQVARPLEIRGNLRNVLNETYYASPDTRWVYASGRSFSLTAVVQF